MRIAQMIFRRTGANSKKYAGRYKTGPDVNSLISTWKPEDILPRVERELPPKPKVQPKVTPESINRDLNSIIEDLKNEKLLVSPT
jgi:hypothetical protein